METFMSAQLTYYIFEGVLTGFAGGKTFHITALSGGRGGSKAQDAGTDAVNNPYMNWPEDDLTQSWKAVGSWRKRRAWRPDSHWTIHRREAGY
jgi:hypothetical protein